MTTNIEAILSAIEERATSALPYECNDEELGQTLFRDVPALVKALRESLEWVTAGTRKLLEPKLAEILSESQPQPIEPTKQ